MPGASSSSGKSRRAKNGPMLRFQDSAAIVRCSGVMLTRISFSAWTKVSGVMAGPGGPAASPGVPEKMLPVPEPAGEPPSGPALALPAATPASASAPSARNRRRDFRSAMCPPSG